jgi:nitroreductase
MQYPVAIIDQLIRNRRMIKPESFAPGKIDNELIRELLENANWAPTHGLTEPWRFAVFTGVGLETLGAFHAQLYKNETPAAQFVQGKYDKLMSRPLLASHVIVVGMERQLSEKIPLVEEIAATCCSIQNLLLAASARNIAAYWGSGGMTYHEEMKSLIDISPKGQCLGLIYLGKMPADVPQGSRNNIADKVRWVS